MLIKVNELDVDLNAYSGQREKCQVDVKRTFERRFLIFIVDKYLGRRSKILFALYRWWGRFGFGDKYLQIRNDVFHSVYVLNGYSTRTGSSFARNFVSHFIFRDYLQLLLSRFFQYRVAVIFRNQSTQYRIHLSNLDVSLSKNFARVYLKNFFICFFCVLHDSVGIFDCLNYF